MDDNTKTCIGYSGATVICVTALIVDGVTAQTLSLGVAAAMAGLAGFQAGKVIRNGWRK